MHTIKSLWNHLHVKKQHSPAVTEPLSSLLCHLVFAMHLLLFSVLWILSSLTYLTVVSSSTLMISSSTQNPLTNINVFSVKSSNSLKNTNSMSKLTNVTYFWNKWNSLVTPSTLQAFMLIRVKLMQLTHGLHHAMSLKFSHSLDCAITTVVSFSVLVNWHNLSHN